MIRSTCFLIVLTLLEPSAAQAAACAGTTQADLNQCAGRSFRKADDHLNDLYQQITGRLRNAPGTAAALVTAQKAWIAFRDAECAFATIDTIDGSIHPMEVLGCEEELTTRRIKDLQRYLDCNEVDTSCPVPKP